MSAFMSACHLVNKKGSDIALPHWQMLYKHTTESLLDYAISTTNTLDWLTKSTMNEHTFITSNIDTKFIDSNTI